MIAEQLLISTVLISGLQDKRITQIASGSSHSLALDDRGHVYAWGNAGYAKLGLGDQENRYVPFRLASDARMLILAA